MVHTSGGLLHQKGCCFISAVICAMPVPALLEAMGTIRERSGSRQEQRAEVAGSLP